MMLHCEPIYAAPSIFSAAIYRLNLTTFCLTMNLLSNGGADVRALNISYRVIGAGTVWSVPVLMPVIQSAELSVRAVIEVTQSVADAGRMEFRMSALNALSFETSSLDLTETVGNPKKKIFFFFFFLAYKCLNRVDGHFYAVHSHMVCLCL